MDRAPLLLALAAALTLAAGESAARPKKKPPPPPPAPVVQAAPAPPPRPVIPTLAVLMSDSEEGVKARLGVPDMARREAASALWTYAWPDCALMVFFKSPDGRTLRVSGATAGPRRRGQAAPTVDACLAQNHNRPRPSQSDAIDALLAPPG